MFYMYKFLRYVNFEDVTNSAIFNSIFEDHHAAYQTFTDFMAAPYQACCTHDSVKHYNQEIYIDLTIEIAPRIYLVQSTNGLERDNRMGWKA